MSKLGVLYLYWGMVINPLVGITIWFVDFYYMDRWQTTCPVSTLARMLPDAKWRPPESGANTAPATESPKAPDVARMVIWTPGGSIVGSHPDFAGKKHQKPRVFSQGVRGMPVRQTKSTRLQLHLFHLFPPQLGWSANLCPVPSPCVDCSRWPLKVWAKFETEAYFHIWWNHQLYGNYHGHSTWNPGAQQNDPNIAFHRGGEPQSQAPAGIEAQWRPRKHQKTRWNMLDPAEKILA